MQCFHPIRAWFFAAVAIFALTPPSNAQLVTEAQVKAAYVYNFAKFVEWPERSFNSSNAPLRLCVWNDPSFQSELQRVTVNKNAGGHPVTTASVIDADDARTVLTA
jgi:YfiR/HmsC-like